MKHCGVKADIKATDGVCLFNCFDVDIFLVEEFSSIDVNVTTDNDFLHTHRSIVGVLLYGAETCAPTQELVGRLDRFH